MGLNTCNTCAFGLLNSLGKASCDRSYVWFWKPGFPGTQEVLGDVRHRKSNQRLRLSTWAPGICSIFSCWGPAYRWCRVWARRTPACCLNFEVDGDLQTPQPIPAKSMTHFLGFPRSKGPPLTPSVKRAAVSLVSPPSKPKTLCFMVSG